MGIEHGDDGSDDVANMDDGTPGRAVALDVDPARGERRGYQIVQYDVEAQSRRHAIRGRIAHVSRGETVAGQRCDVAFHQNLRLAVGGDRIQGGGLVQEIVAGSAVSAARGREDEARYARLFRESCQLHRGKVVDVVGELRIEIPERIVRQCGQVHDRIEAPEIRHGQITEIFADFRNCREAVRQRSQPA